MLEMTCKLRVFKTHKWFINIDINNGMKIFSENGKPLLFDSNEEAWQYIKANNIKGLPDFGF